MEGSELTLRNGLTGPWNLLLRTHIFSINVLNLKAVSN